MEVSVFDKDGITVISVSGRMDATSVDAFNTHCKSALDKGAMKILVDFSDLEYISSAGLRGVLILAKSSKAKGVPVAFCSMQTMVAEVFKISGFTNILAIYASKDEAIQNMIG